VSLRLELCERVPVPPIGDDVGFVGHQHFEAVKLAYVDVVRELQPQAQQIEELVEARDVGSHLATMMSAPVHAGAFRSTCADAKGPTEYLSRTAKGVYSAISYYVKPSPRRAKRPAKRALASQTRYNAHLPGLAARVWPEARTPPTRIARKARSFKANGILLRGHSLAWAG
jgi:hypothetical protein